MPVWERREQGEGAFDREVESVGRSEMKPIRLNPLVCLLIAALFAWGCRQDPEPEGHSPEGKNIFNSNPTALPLEAESANRLLDGLKTGDMASRQGAAEEIHRLEEIDETTLNELQALLKADSPQTRIAAAYALG